ncbi:MAG: exo-alpha-sialidase [Actinophytocola sp.]|nr:exo-alpha-sialidase [Actinophytocola sp.]
MAVRPRNRGGISRLPGVTALIATTGLLLSGCADDAPSPAHDDGPGGGTTDLAHIHGLGINPADDVLYVASHHGVFRVTGKDDPVQVAGRTQDFMGFTVIGPDHFLGSGHLGPEDADQPPHLGLIESTDAAETWRSVSLSGEADFHAMEAKHDRVYGFDSQSGRLMVSEDRKSWDSRAGIGLADLAVSPANAEEMLATTERGPARSTDGGRTFDPIGDAPTLVFVDWPAPDRLIGVAPDSVVYTSDDGGESWTTGGQVAGRPQAIVGHGDAEVYLATEGGIHHSADNGKTFSEFQSLQP